MGSSGNDEKQCECDRRCNERIVAVEKRVNSHINDHHKLEKALAENVRMTTQIAENTTELVELFKGAKGFRSFIIWAAPIVVIFMAVYAWIKSH